VCDEFINEFNCFHLGHIQNWRVSLNCYLIHALCSSSAQLCLSSVQFSILYPIPLLFSSSTLSPCPNDMSHPPMPTSFLSPSSHSVGRSSFVQGGDRSWPICRATMTVFLYNSPSDSMEGWHMWGLWPSWSLRSQLPQPQSFQELETTGSNTTSCHERATIGYLNLSFRMSLELRDTPRSGLRMS
jgi:hypothetical protein